jgi:hypothetical protein
VRSSAGQHVRSHGSKSVAVLCKCVRSQLWCVRTQHCTASLSEGPVLARRCVMSSYAGARSARTQVRERSGIGGSAVERSPHTKFGYSQENEPLGRIALRKYRDRTTENGVL